MLTAGRRLHINYRACPPPSSNAIVGERPDQDRWHHAIPGIMIAACPALRARARGVLQRRGHTEASVDLVSLAGLYPASVICEIVNTTAPWREYLTIGFCTRHDLIMFTITDLVQYRLENDDQSRTMNSSPHLWPTTKVWSLRLNQAHVDHRVFGAFCDKLRG